VRHKDNVFMPYCIIIGTLTATVNFDDVFIEENRRKNVKGLFLMLLKQIFMLLVY